MTEAVIKAWIRSEIELSKPTERLIITSPDGSKWEITIDDAGVLSQTKL